MLKSVDNDDEEETPATVPIVSDSESESEDESENEPLLSVDKNDNVVSDDEEDLEDPNLLIPSKISRELRGLTTSYNTEAQKVLDNLEKRVTRSEARQDKVLRSDSNAKDIGMAEITRFLIDVAKVAKPENVNENYIEPKTFQEAWHHKDAIQREKWREAIRKEFRDMTKRSCLAKDKNVRRTKW